MLVTWCHLLHLEPINRWRVRQYKSERETRVGVSRWLVQRRNAPRHRLWETNCRNSSVQGSAFQLWMPSSASMQRTTSIDRFDSTSNFTMRPYAMCARSSCGHCTDISCWCDGWNMSALLRTDTSMREGKTSDFRSNSVASVTSSRRTFHCSWSVLRSTFTCCIVVLLSERVTRNS